MGRGTTRRGLVSRLASQYAAATSVAVALSLTIGCSATRETPPAEGTEAASQTAVQVDDYVIGPGDSLRIFVWRNKEFSADVPVRPDGKISTPLVEDIDAVGKTPSQLARQIEQRLSTYIRNPIVTVIVTNFIGASNQQIKVIGEAASPKTIPYYRNMTLLDVVIAVGGLTESAAGNKARLVRGVGTTRQVIDLRLQDLVQGDISADVRMKPGDIVIVPESWF